MRLLDDIKVDCIHWIAESSGMMIFQLILMNIIEILYKVLMNQLCMSSQTAKFLAADSVQPNDAF